MSAAQIDLLITIARGKYLPTLNRDVISTLAVLFRRGFVSYGGSAVSITGTGRTALEKAIGQ